MTRDEVSNKLVAYFQKNGYLKARNNGSGVTVYRKNSCDLNVLLEKQGSKHVIVHVYPHYGECQFDLGWAWEKTWEAADFERLNKAVDEAKNWIESADRVGCKAATRKANKIDELWQDKMKSVSSRKVMIKQSNADKGKEKELRRNKVQKRWDSFQNKDDECELRKVLSTNPFTQEIVDGWRKLLKKGGDERFVLPCDEKFLQKIIESETHANYEPLPSLLPQPFAGDPRGDIWLLLDNPGYTPIDKFDNISVADKDDVFEKVRDMMLSEFSRIRNADERKRREQSCGLLNSSDLFVARSQKEDMECLCRRQTLMLNQLLLSIDKDLPFFWLDESFRTVKANVFGSKLVGGHLWWRTKLNKFLREKNDVRRVFAMEYFPYHSRNFNHNFKHNQLVKWASESCYHKFWRAMVEYGRKHGKRIIARGKWMVDGSVDDRILDSDKYFEFVSPRNCSLSLNNIKMGS